MQKTNSDISRRLFEQAREVIPGGVNSPVRAFRNVGGTCPLFIKKALGASISDVDGNQYIDFVGSWGPMILGHAAQPVIEALNRAALSGTSFGAPCEVELKLAKLIANLVPAAEQIRMVNSGTEATMSAIRLARGVSGKNLIIKCDGCYHGHSDSLLIEAGSGVATQGIAGSLGVPAEIAALTISIPFNDPQALLSAIDKFGAEKIAAFILEPVPGNMGLIRPKEGFLQEVRKICTEKNILLIFDEVMSGFRVGLNGASGLFNLNPDLITFGKVIGGGLPVGAFAGRRELMSKLSPEGEIYQAGTLSGNPLAMAAGLATLEILAAENPYKKLEQLAIELTSGLKEAAAEKGIAMQITYIGSMFGFFFTSEPVTNYKEAKLCDQELFKKFFWGMLNEGVYLAPSAFETGFISTAHNKDLIDETLEAGRRVFAKL